VPIAKRSDVDHTELPANTPHNIGSVGRLTAMRLRLVSLALLASR